MGRPVELQKNRLGRASDGQFLNFAGTCDDEGVQVIVSSPDWATLIEQNHGRSGAIEALERLAEAGEETRHPTEGMQITVSLLREVHVSSKRGEGSSIHNEPS